MTMDRQTETFDRTRIFTLTAAILTIALVGMGLNLVFPLLSIRLAEAGYSGSFIGLSTAASGIANIASAPFVPRLAQRYGVRTVLLGALAVSIGTILLFDPLPNPIIGIILRFLFGLALGTLFLMSEFWINAASPEAHRGLVLGIYGSILALGFASGPILLDLVGTNGQTAFLIGAAIFAVAALPIAFTAGYAPAIDGGSDVNVLTFLLSAPTATLAGFVFGVIETSAFSLLPVYGLAVGLTVSASALLISAMALGNILQIPLGILADRFDRRTMLLCCGICGAIGCVLMPFMAGSPVVLMVTLFLWGGISAGLYTIGLTLLGANYHGADLAHANATFVILYSAGMIVGPPLIGAGMDKVPPNGMFYAIGLLFALYAAIIAYRLKRGLKS